MRSVERRKGKECRYRRSLKNKKKKNKKHTNPYKKKLEQMKKNNKTQINHTQINNNQRNTKKRCACKKEEKSCHEIGTNKIEEANNKVIRIHLSSCYTFIHDNTSVCIENMNETTKNTTNQQTTRTPHKVYRYSQHTH